MSRTQLIHLDEGIALLPGSQTNWWDGKTVKLSEPNLLTQLKALKLSWTEEDVSILASRKSEFLWFYPGGDVDAEERSRVAKLKLVLDSSLLDTDHIEEQ